MTSMELHLQRVHQGPRRETGKRGGKEREGRKGKGREGKGEREGKGRGGHVRVSLHGVTDLIMVQEFASCE